VAVVDTLARWVSLEMDLRLEAAAIAEMAENTAEDPGFRTPRVDWMRTARRVLVTEWIDGISLGEPDRIAAAGHDLRQLAVTIIQTFLRHALRDGFFHADMHQGNLFVDAAGRLVAVDYGIMGRLTPRERRFLAEILYGFIRRDYTRVAEVHFEAGYVPADQPTEFFAQALRSIGEPLQDRTAREISMARVLTQLFEVTELFNMETRPELLLLQKTMVVVEGVGRTLDPELNMWAAAEPVVREWIARFLGPQGQVEAARRGTELLARVLFDLPQRLAAAERAFEDLLTFATRGHRLEPESVEALSRAMVRDQALNTIAYWIIAAALVAIAAALIWR
jgi:ubiquinone biosynthesis protein